MDQIPADIDPAIKNPKFWSNPAAKRKHYHISECDFVEVDAPDWWNVMDDNTAPIKRFSSWRDPNGTRVDDFDWDGMAVYTDYDLSFAFNDPLGMRFIAPPTEPVYSEESEKVEVQTDAEVKAAHNKVETVEITAVEINKKSRTYKHAQEFIELLSKHAGIASVKLGDKTIKHESEADVDPSNEFFIVPGIGSIVFVLAKAILFFTAPTTAAPTKLSLLKGRLDDYQSKFRTLQIQHRIAPTEDVNELEKRAISLKLLADKIAELKAEIDGRMNTAPRTSAGVRAEAVTCRRLLKMVCKQNEDARRFVEALRDICKTDVEIECEEIKHLGAMFHIRANKMTKADADKIKKKGPVPVSVPVSVPVPMSVPVSVPVSAPVSAPAPAPVPRKHAPPPAKKGPSRSEKLAALRGKK